MTTESNQVVLEFLPLTQSAPDSNGRQRQIYELRSPERTEGKTHVGVGEQQNLLAKSVSDPSLLVLRDHRGMVIHLALLIVLGLLASWPVLVHGAPDLSHDGVDHARWAKQFASQFWLGDWYPRWFTDVNGGLGGPSGFFYPPLTNYVSALFWPFMAARDPGGWLVAGYALGLAEVLSGIAAYLWLRSLVKPGAALLGAVVYLVAPYHLAVDAYLRGASAEFWVFVWFPLVLLSAEGLLRHSRWAIAGASVSYGLAVFSHPTVSLCFAPIPVAYVLCFSERKERARATLLMASALLLGVALNAEYLLPAILDQNQAYVAWQTIGHGDFQNQWLWQDNHELAEMGRYLYGALTRTSYQIYWETLIKLRFLLVTLATLAGLVGLFLAVCGFEKTGRLRRIAVFYGMVALLSLFLMTKFSLLIWQLTPFMKFVQYPFRLNVLLVLSVTVLAAVSGPCLLQPRYRLVMLFLCMLAAVWVGLDTFSASQVFSVWRTITPDRADRIRQMIRTQIDYPAMWPKPADPTMLENFATFDRFLAMHPPKTARIEAISTGQTSGMVRVESWKPRYVVLKIEASQDSQLTLNHFYYAGWQGRIDSAGTVLNALPSPGGLIQMDVPKGDYVLIVELPRDRAERAGRMIFLLSLLLLGAVVIGTRRPFPALKKAAVTR